MHKVSQKLSSEKMPGYKRAVEFMSRNQLRYAMDRCEEVLLLSPDDAEHMSLYGLCVARYTENFPLAVKLCKRAIDLNPADPIFRVNLGKVFRMQGDNANAHESFTQAWSEDKSLPSASAEVARMGIRRPPVLPSLPRSHWLNIKLGKLRAAIEPLQRWQDRGAKKRKRSSLQES